MRYIDIETGKYETKIVKSCKCNKRFNDSIGHEIKVLNHVLQRKLIYSAKDKGVDKLTLMHGWIIAYLYDHRDEDVYQDVYKRQSFRFACI